MKIPFPPEDLLAIVSSGCSQQWISWGKFNLCGSLHLFIPH